MNRRDFLTWVGLGTLAGMTGERSLSRSATGVSLGGLSLPSAQASFVPDVELALRAVAGEAGILSGAPTRVWTR